MRPELKVLNAHLAKKRAEKKQADREKNECYMHGYRNGMSRRPKEPGCRVYKATFHINGEDKFMMPFAERMEVAKRRLAAQLADILIEEMEIEHETVPYMDGEVWKAQIAIGKIERQIWDRYRL